MFYGPVGNQATINSNLDPLAKHNKPVVKNVGVIFEN